MTNNRVAMAQFIGREIAFQQAQAQFFLTRARVGPIASDVAVFMPRIDPPKAALSAIFVEPGAVHLVFLDEVYPTDPGIDRRYRTERRQFFGRTTDVESFELLVRNGALECHFQNNWSSLNIYETSAHLAGAALFQGQIFVNTWNHMLSTIFAPDILLRGGYVKADVEVQNGSRKDAEVYSPAKKVVSRTSVGRVKTQLRG